DGVDACQCGQYVSAVLLFHDGPAHALEPADGGVGVDADYQPVAERASTGEIRHVTAVQDVEAAVREHDSLSARSCVAPDECIAIENPGSRIMHLATPILHHGAGGGGTSPSASRLRRSTSPAPRAISSRASVEPMSAPSNAAPVRSPRTIVRPSSEATMPCRMSRSPSTVPRAPIGIWQPPSRLARNERSASVAARAAA